MADQYAVVPAQSGPFAPQVSVVPADGDPFMSVQPVAPHDAFFSSDVADPYASAPHEVLTPGQREGFRDAWQTFGAPIASAVTAPGDIMAGKLGMDDPRFADSAMTAAGLVTTGGMPFSEEGALGSAGGKINWDRKTVGRGSPLAPGTSVIDVPVGALDSAFKQHADGYYIDKPKPQVMDHAMSGQPMSLPEVGAVDGRIGFQNGRNRFAAARDAGETIIPVAVETGNVKDVLEALSHHTPATVQTPGNIVAYHGSPHDFEQFDLGKIGTGEGAQAYGHGLYFAQNEGVAKSYRDALSGSPGPANDVAKYWRTAAGDDKEKAVQMFTEFANGAQLKPHEIAETVKNIRDSGHMYQVGINADPEHFLDWDKPIGEQHPVVQEAMQKLGIGKLAEDPAATAQSIYRLKVAKYWTSAASGDRDAAVKMFGQFGQKEGLSPAEIGETSRYIANGSTSPEVSLTAPKRGEQAYKEVVGPDTSHEAHAAAVQQMKDAGIPGIRYKDAGSRNWTPDENATHNYVVFDPKNIAILKKYGLAGLGLGAAGLAGSAGGSQPASAAPYIPGKP